MSRSTMLKLMHKLNKLFNLINKHFYIITIFTWVFNKIYNIKSNKLLYVTYNIIKIILFISIIFSVAIIAYFTDLNPALNNLHSMYYDLLEPYIEIIKHSYDKLVNYFNSILDNFKSPQLNIENEIKTGIKSGIKEALEEVIEDIETESKMKSDNLIKQFIIASSVLFTLYLFLYLPGSDVNAQDISQYNSFNQFLINLKVTVIDIFSNSSGKPGAPGTPGSTNISPPISPSEVSTYFKSPASVTESIATITPNTPVASTSSLDVLTQNTAGVINNTSTSISPINTVPSISNYIEKEVATDILSCLSEAIHTSKEVETDISGFVVSRMVETMDVIQEAMDKETLDKLEHNARTRVTKIWH